MASSPTSLRELCVALNSHQPIESAPCSIIIKGLGFGLYETVLLDIPSSLFQIGSLVLSGYIAGRFKNMRCIMMVRAFTHKDLCCTLYSHGSFYPG